MTELSPIEETAVLEAYLCDAEAAERFFAIWSGTEPRPLSVVLASIPEAQERHRQRESAAEAGK